MDNPHNLPAAQIAAIESLSASELAELAHLLSRVRTLRFFTDGLKGPGSELLARIWQAEAPNVPAPDCAALLSEAGLNIRQALMELELALVAAPRPASWRCVNCRNTELESSDVCSNCGWPRWRA